MKILTQVFLLLACYTFPPSGAHAQYVQKERGADSIIMMAKAPFDTLAAKAALAPGSATIKGVAFTKPRTGYGFKAPLANRIYANKIKVLLFPVTPYLLEYLDLKKKENFKKHKYAFLSNEAWRYHYEAITNSTGDFTFPNLKPGQYYIEGLINWNSTGYYNEYTGSGYSDYGTTNYYTRQYYNIGHADLLQKIVEIKDPGEVLEVKLK